MGLRQRSTLFRAGSQSNRVGGRSRVKGAPALIAARFEVMLFAALLLMTVGLAFRAHVLIGLAELAMIVVALVYGVRTTAVKDTSPGTIR